MKDSWQCRSLPRSATPGKCCIWICMHLSEANRMSPCHSPKTWHNNSGRVYHTPCNVNAFCPLPESKPIQFNLIMCFRWEVMHVDVRYDGAEFERNSTNFAGRCDYPSIPSIRERYYDEWILEQVWYSASNFQIHIQFLKSYNAVIADFYKNSSRILSADFCKIRTQEAPILEKSGAQSRDILKIREPNHDFWKRIAIYPRMILKIRVLARSESSRNPRI